MPSLGKKEENAELTDRPDSRMLFLFSGFERERRSDGMCAKSVTVVRD